MSPVRNQPSCVEALGVGGGLLPVAGKHRRTANQELAVLGQLQLNIGQRHAGGAHALLQGRVDGDDGRGFGEAVALPERDADRGEPARGIDAQGRAAGDEDSDPAAKGFAHLGIDELVGQLPDAARLGWRPA